MIELWQTEWCPASHRVRERLTLAVAGKDSIPVLLLEDGSAVVGEAAIGSWLDDHFTEPAGAEAHRQKAAKARSRYLEEECTCLQPITR